MFSILSILIKQELEKIYELTYKYGWLTATEREQDQLSDRAYMEKARIEGELEPLIDHGLGELKEVFDWRVNLLSIDQITKYMNKGINIEELSTFIDWFSRYNLEHSGDVITNTFFEVEEADITAILNYIMASVKKYLVTIDYTTLIMFWLNFQDKFLGHTDSLDYYMEAFIEYLLDTTLGDQQLELYEELDFLNAQYKNKAEEYFIALHEDNFIRWLEKELPRETLINGPFHEEFIAAIEVGAFDELISGDVFTQLKETFYKDILPNLDFVKMNKNMKVGYEQLNQVTEKSSLSDKIIAFQVGLTTTHYSGDMSVHLLETGEQQAEDFLNQLSSDKYVAQWNKELQQSTGISVGASIHLKSALILLRTLC